MKKTISNVLLENLMEDARQIILSAHKLENLPSEILHTKPAPGKWSVAQVLEHLNFYSHYYLKAIEEKLHKNQRPPNEFFTPGLLGNYFTGMMKPTDKNTIPNKMKTFRNAEPHEDTDGKAALAEFIQQSDTLMNLLNIARTANLDAIRIPISITRWISLKLGDTFRFFIAHQQRHFLQIKNTLDVLQPSARLHQ